MRKLYLQTNRLFRLSRALFLLAAGFSAVFGAAAFEVSDTQGKKHRLADYQGRWVIVNFWATWCVPCIQEIPEIASFHKEHGKVVVIGVAMDAENPAKVKQFATKVGHAYPLVLSDARVEKQLGDPKALPTTRVYDPTGKVVYDRVGRVTKKSLEELTRSKAVSNSVLSSSATLGLVQSFPSAQRSRSALFTKPG